MSTIWIWGRHPVLEAIRTDSARRVLMAAGRDPSPILREIRQVARERGIPIQEVEPRDIERLATGQNTQGVAAEVVEQGIRDVAELLAGSTAPHFLLALDQVQDPHNLGALLRTANAAGVGGAIMPDRHSAPLSGVVAKASAGAVSHVPLVRVPNLVRALDDLREAGVWVMGLDGEARTAIFGADLTVPLALVIGSEGRGLRRLTREHCDLLLHLPMRGAVSSLNASVAGSIAMYEVLRQRSIAAGT